MINSYYIYGGKIHTMCELGRVDSMLIVGERIAAVGEADEIAPYLPAGTETIDLGGRAVVPGFHDSHIHLLKYATTRKQIDLVHVETIEEALKVIKEVADRTKPGEWILGRGWDRSVWREFPTKEQLDSVTNKHPVMLVSKCGHSVWVNSTALSIAGINKETAAPEGGSILRDIYGEPTGVLLDKASSLVWTVAPQLTAEFVYNALAECIPLLWSMGITCVHTPEQSGLFGLVRKLRIDKDLPIRVAFMPPLSDLAMLESFGIRQDYGDDWVWTSQIKMFKDGSLGAKTALLSESYLSDARNHGLEVMNEQEMTDKVRQSVLAGYGTAVHAIGDRAVSETLNSIESCRTESITAGVRHRIEHAQYIRAEDIDRFRRLGVIASVQPSHIVADRYMSDRDLGDFSQRAFPLASLEKSGALLAFGSDAPVDSPDPIYGIHCAVNRCAPGEPEEAAWYPAERISVESDLKAYTRNAAVACGKENLIGELAEGKYADFVILSMDPLNIDEKEITSLEVEAVCLGGRFVYGPDWA